MDIKYIKKIMPSFHRNGSFSQAMMFEEYLRQPVHFTMDSKAQDDMALRGRDTGFEWVLPYKSMSVSINRKMRAGDNIVHLDTVWFGIVDDVLFPSPQGINALLVKDFARDLVWLQDNAESMDQILEITSRWRHIVEPVLRSQSKSILRRFHKMGFEDKGTGLLFDIDQLPEDVIAQAVIRDCANNLLHDLIKELADQVEAAKCWVYYVRYKTQSNEFREMFKVLNPTTDWEYVYDIEHTGSMFETIQRVKDRYFKDGHSGLINEFVVNLVKGLSSAWANQQVEERRVKPTKRQRKMAKESPSGVRIRTLRYDAKAGSIVTTKRVSEDSEDANVESHTWTQAGHERASTFAFVWVLEKNVGLNEVEYDIQERSNGSIWIKVMRPRKGCTVNGGSESPILGRIKAV